jgi:hypothetical protein
MQRLLNPGERLRGIPREGSGLPFFFFHTGNTGPIVRANYDRPIPGHRAAPMYRNDVPK